MASIVKQASGNYQAKVRLKGHSFNKMFPKFTDAEDWAQATEHLRITGRIADSSTPKSLTLQELMTRYEKEILPSKRSIRSILTVIHTITLKLGRRSINELKSSDIASFRDLRLKTVSRETVRKDLLFLRRLLKAAEIDWGINLPNGNVAELVRLPKPGMPRSRRLNARELKILETCEIADYCVLAIETGMRRGEIASIQPNHIKTLASGIVLLDIPITKTDSPRTIPLSERAQDAVTAILALGLIADSISRKFTDICRRNTLVDLRFHDLRHEATSRLFEKGLSTMEVAAITGHKDLKMLSRYTHIKPQHLARVLGYC